METIKYIYGYSSKDVFFFSMPNNTTTIAIMTKTVANIKNMLSTDILYDNNVPTNNGAIIPPILPIPAAQPEPSPLIRVGYNSGVYVYSTPQAPKLKNDIKAPHISKIISVSAWPKK